MKRRMVLTVCAMSVLALVFADTSLAGKFNKKVDVGDKAPKFKNLAGIDGEKHSLSDYQDAKVVVIAFTCNHCPVAKAYEDRFIEFTKKYRDKGVAFVAINVNTIKADRLPRMKERAAKQGFNFPYLYDPTQEIGRQYGATVTPHLFVLDRDREIAYMGAFDDSQNRNEVNHHYVRDAVDALLAGGEPAVKESRQFGCSIKYNK